jgi:hypothetical protein
VHHHHEQHHHQQQKQTTTKQPKSPASCPTVGPLYGGPLRTNAEGTAIPIIGAGTPIPPNLQCIPID